MYDMNIAKLTSVDLPLFKGIVSDLFPGVDPPTIDNSKVIFSLFCLCDFIMNSLYDDV